VASAWGKAWGVAFGAAWGVLEDTKKPVYVPGSGGGRIVRDSDVLRRRPGKTRQQRQNEQILLTVLM